MAKKELISRKSEPPSGLPKLVFMTHYEITDEPIQDQYYRRLPQHVKDAVKRLHKEAQTKPRKAIPELKKMIKQYPKVPQFYNYLTVAYSRLGETGKAQAVNRANIRKNPDYLFARLNYAEFCLHKKDYARIPEIFDHKFDLQLLYPKRKRFHIAEAANFMGLIGIYFYEIHERELAEKYNEVLQEIAPDYPMAKILKRKLSPNLIVRLWKRLTGS
jgi:tetratricopeptide (TPR) repeat protein